MFGVVSMVRYECDFLMIKIMTSIDGYCLWIGSSDKVLILLVFCVVDEF